MSRRPLRAAALLAALAAGACGDRSGTTQAPPPVEQPQPRVVDVAGIASDGLVAAVLDECHQPLRGRMQRVTARVQLADGRRKKVFAELPAPARVQSSDGMFLWRDGAVHRLDLANPDPAQRAIVADAAATAHVTKLVTLIDAAAFGPLHRATACRRTGPADFDVDTAEGTTWHLTLRPQTLLPASLALGGVRVQFDDYLRTPISWVARVASTDGLGRCEVVFEDAGTIWDRDFFALPGDAPAPGADPADDSGHHRIASPGSNVEVRSAAPEEVSSKAMRWVVLDDPAVADDDVGWAARAASYTPVHEELRRQDQQIAGFPILFTEGERRYLAVPFRTRKNGQPLDAPTDWRMRDIPTGRWLVVHPPAGDYGARCALGAVLLQKALDARGVSALSPITAQPFLHLEDGPPPADKLRAPTVRVAVRIE
ncbi:MAG: hypothetical protein R3F29_06485 [Planctomycetota bacterium]